MTTRRTRRAENPPPEAGPFWCLLSGGKDSVAAATTLALRGELSGCVFIDTGIAVPGVREFVCRICAERGWELKIARASESSLKYVSFEDFVRKFGFPGRAQHSMVMDYLKARAVYGIHRKHPEMVFASGVRSHESVRRMANAQEWGSIRGAKVYAPILDWRTEDVWAFIRDHDLELSPAYRELHLSGDCLCGAYAQPEEIHLISAFYPDVAERILKLEDELAAKPPPCDARRLRWGGGGGARGAREQSKVESFLCQNCEVSPSSPSEEHD